MITLEEMIASLPAGYGWLVRSPLGDAEGFFAHIMGPEFEATKTRLAPKQSYTGRAATPAQAFAAAITKMDEAR